MQQEFVIWDFWYKKMIDILILLFGLFFFVCAFSLFKKGWELFLMFSAFGTIPISIYLFHSSLTISLKDHTISKTDYFAFFHYRNITYPFEKIDSVKLGVLTMRTVRELTTSISKSYRIEMIYREKSKLKELELLTLPLKECAILANNLGRIISNFSSGRISNNEQYFPPMAETQKKAGIHMIFSHFSAISIFIVCAVLILNQV